MANPEGPQLVVIGAGPGGYPAAFAAADAGLGVTLVDDGPAAGGTCLHRGCIPSKALLHLARGIRTAAELAECGVQFAEPRIDLERIRAWTDEVVDRLAAGIGQLAAARALELVSARAEFLDAGTLRLSAADGRTSTLSFEQVIIATGSRPARPPGLDLDDPRVMDSTTALDLAEIPERLLVIGGGYIGLEMGTVYAALGSRVSVVEMTSGLLPGVDRDLVRPLGRRLGEQFEAIHTGTRVESLVAESDGVRAVLVGEGESRREATFEGVLVAVGRRPNSDGLGLETIGITFSPEGHVMVDESGRTSVANVFAVGDVCGEPMLAHKATADAKRVVAALSGTASSQPPRVIPAVVFTDPEVAWCGLTETAAKETGLEVQAVRMSWAASGRAHTLGRAEGLTKLVYEPESRRLLGVGIVGVGAGELIAEGVLAVQQGLSVDAVAETVHPHPTLAETLGEAAEHVLGRAVHVSPRRPRS